jgi:hypothetical protein
VNDRFKFAIFDSAGFCKWLKSALPGELRIYHAGNLGVDRVDDQELNVLADLVLLMTELGAVTTTQYRQYLNIIDVWVYVAVRRRGGLLPKAIVNRSLTSIEYRALRAIRDRDADISAARAIRDALSSTLTSSDVEAHRILEGLKARNFVEEAPGKGWQLSAPGLRVMT